MTNPKPAYGDLEQRIEALEEELSFQRQSAGREFYEKFIDAAAGNGIEMLTEVGYEMAARIGDLECQRDELIAENSKQLTILLDLGRRLNIATGAIKSTVPLEVDGCISGWRTIDTAPRDGTEVDLFHPDYGRITGSHWDPDLESWIILPANSFPTHWMPVPEGP